MHFYPGMDYEKARALTLPQMQGLLDEIPNIYKTLNPAGSAGGTGSGAVSFASAKRM